MSKLEKPQLAAFRTDAGFCVGHVSIKVGGGIVEPNTKLLSVALFSNLGSYFSHMDNFNIQILDTVGEAMREWENQR